MTEKFEMPAAEVARRHALRHECSFEPSSSPRRAELLVRASAGVPRSTSSESISGQSTTYLSIPPNATLRLSIGARSTFGR